MEIGNPDFIWNVNYLPIEAREEKKTFIFTPARSGASKLPPFLASFYRIVFCHSPIPPL